jgi:hypothetical protein
MAEQELIAFVCGVAAGVAWTAIAGVLFSDVWHSGGPLEPTRRPPVPDSSVMECEQRKEAAGR